MWGGRGHGAPESRVARRRGLGSLEPALGVLRAPRERLRNGDKCRVSRHPRASLVTVCASFFPHQQRLPRAPRPPLPGMCPLVTARAPPGTCPLVTARTHWLVPAPPGCDFQILRWLALSCRHTGRLCAGSVATPPAHQTVHRDLHRHCCRHCRRWPSSSHPMKQTRLRSYC